MNFCGNSKLTGFPVYFQAIDTLQDMADFSPSTRYFVLMLACDATKLSTAKISRLADDLMAKGMVYLCSWGPDCERLHDIVDESAVPFEEDAEISEDFVVMTTCHAGESLEKALWFALGAALPPDACRSDCSAIVVSVGNAEWEKQISGKLARLNAFLGQTKPLN